MASFNNLFMVLFNGAVGNSNYIGGTYFFHLQGKRVMSVLTAAINLHYHENLLLYKIYKMKKRW
jgi:hypothetical protein